MKIILLIVGAAYLLTPILTYFVGYRSGASRRARETLSSVGLTASTADRYRDAMRLLNSLISGMDLDGPYLGSTLTEPARREASRLVSAHRKELGL
jgi:hypothetical protein